MIAVNPVDRPDDWRLDSVGLPPPGVTMRVVDLDTGARRRAGRHRRTARPEPVADDRATFPTTTPTDRRRLVPHRRRRDGRRRGWVTITDRVKEMIKVNGFQVAPAEVEGVLLGHAGVVDCAGVRCTGSAHRRGGRRCRGASGRPAPEVGAATNCASSSPVAFASYKRVQHVLFLDQIPRLPSGKVLRRGAEVCAARSDVDARPSPEQRQLEDAAERLALKLGPSTVADLDDDERRQRLDAALAQDRVARAARRHAGPRPSRPASKRRSSLGRSLGGLVTRRSSARCWRATCCAVRGRRRRRRRPHDRRVTRVAAPAVGGRSGVAGRRPGRRRRRQHVGRRLDRRGDGHAVGRVAARTAGRPDVDLTRPVADLDRPAPLSPRSRGRSPLTPDDVTAWTALAVTLTAADLVGSDGGRARAWPRSTPRSDTSTARPIGSYQAVQHLLAEAATLTEGAISAIDPRRMGGRRAGAGRGAGGRRGRQGVRITRRADRLRDGDPGARRHRQHVGVHGPRVPPPHAARNGAVRRRRPQLALLAKQRWGAVHGLR